MPRNPAFAALEDLVGPGLAARLRALEKRIEHLETHGETGLANTDQTIRDAHGRLDSVMGAGADEKFYLPRVAAPSQPPSSYAHVYAKERSAAPGHTGLHVKDETGQEHDLQNPNTVGGYQPGHDAGELPVSDGTLCQNLNAHYHNGLLMPQMWHRANNPDSTDDEFNGTLSSWTVGQSNVEAYDCNATWPSAVMFKIQNASAYFQLYKSFTWSAGTSQNAAAMFYAPINWDGTIVRLTAWDSDFTDGISCQFVRQSSAMVAKLTSIDSSSWTDRTTSSGFQYPSHMLTLILETDFSNNWKAGIGFGSYGWIMFGTYAKNFSASYIHMEVKHESGPTARITYGIEWFRRNWAWLW